MCVPGSVCVFWSLTWAFTGLAFRQRCRGAHLGHPCRASVQAHPAESRGAGTRRGTGRRGHLKRNPVGGQTMTRPGGGSPVGCALGLRFGLDPRLALSPALGAPMSLTRADRHSAWGPAWGPLLFTDLAIG